MTEIAPLEDKQPETQNALEMTGAAMVSSALLEHGVSVVFGYTGGSIIPTIHALEAEDKIRIIHPRHEQGGGHAANGYAQATGKVGVLVVTSGPGATNSITPIKEAFDDSVPLLVLTGQVPTASAGQEAFQECDITGMVASCTKKCWKIERIEDLAQILHEALTLTKSGRPGPVLIDLPKDIQLKIGTYQSLDLWRKERKQTLDAIKVGETPDQDKIRKAVALLETAVKPAILAGGGITSAGAEGAELLRSLAWATNMPVATTLKGIGTLSGRDPHALGMTGMYGTLEANSALHASDAILAIGARFDDRVVCAVKGFAPDAKIIHVDIDPKMIGKIVKTEIGIRGDCRKAMGEITRHWNESQLQHPSLEAWWNKINAWRTEDSTRFKPEDERILPQQPIKILSDMLSNEDVIVTTDVGLHQMWTAHHFKFDAPNRFLTSGGLGTMGFGLPAAIGAQIAHPDKQVLCFTGDGSFQMNSQEMATARCLNLPIKVVILNNKWLGMVRQLEQVGYEGNCAQTGGMWCPDFAKIAEANGWTGLDCASPKALPEALTQLLAAKGPALLNCHVKESENCYPIVPPGQPHNIMLREPATA